ncbi:MAG: UPF0175 family protein [Chloroflexi bacterium]|nr:UPF0175 family protein [Chloroflexota bacterium]MBU1661571.1 UPF0175 family protein [Chloroflexota bacterium]
MNALQEQVKLEIHFPQDIFVAMEMAGLKSENLKAEMKRTTAIDLFKRGLLSLGKAAELAAVPLADFMIMLQEQGIPIAEYTFEDYGKEYA